MKFFLAAITAVLLFSVLQCKEDVLLSKVPSSSGSTSGISCNDVLSSDAFESDNTAASVSAGPSLALNTAQGHNLHNCSDIDHVRITPAAAGFHTIRLQSVSGGLQPNLQLCLGDNQCMASNLLAAANADTLITYYVQNQNYYIRVSSAASTSGSYSAIYQTVTGFATQNISDNETYNNWLNDNTTTPGTDARHASAPALSPGNVYVQNGANGTLGTPSTDLKDIYRLTGITQNTWYTIAVYSPTNNANWHIALHDGSTNSYKQLFRRDVRYGNGFIWFKASSNEDHYLKLGYDDESATNVVISDYRVLFIVSP